MPTVTKRINTATPLKYYLFPRERKERKKILKYNYYLRTINKVAYISIKALY